MFEVDFLPVGDGSRSGDAIAMRFTRPDTGSLAHVIIDGGYEDDGDALVEHFTNVYGVKYVDLVVLTHPDADHRGGIPAWLTYKGDSAICGGGASSNGRRAMDRTLLPAEPGSPGASIGSSASTAPSGRAGPDQPGPARNWRLGSPRRRPRNPPCNRSLRLRRRGPASSPSLSVSHRTESCSTSGTCRTS